MNREYLSVALAILVLILGTGPMGAIAAEDDEEPVEIDSYSVGSPETSRPQKPDYRMERPKLQTGITMDAFKPQLAPPTVELKLDDASFDDAVRVGPTGDQASSEVARNESARPQPASPEPRQQPRQERSAPARQQSGAGGGGSSGGGSDGAGPDIVPVELAAPSYPREAYMDRTEGYVTVEFVIGVDGNVDEATVVESEPRGVFDREAIRAVKRWRFQPVIVDGRATEYRIRHTIDFTM